MECTRDVMTLKYRIFGKPGNFDEFIEKCKKEGVKSVNLESAGYSYTFDSIHKGTRVIATPIGEEGTALKPYEISLWEGRTESIPEFAYTIAKKKRRECEELLKKGGIEVI